MAASPVGPIGAAGKLRGVSDGRTGKEWRVLEVEESDVLSMTDGIGDGDADAEGALSLMEWMEL